jgi:hypothetical protein
LAIRVHAIFSEKCIQCHGANLRKPKGDFGYILDLKQVASNPDIVVPFKPDESKLWNLVEKDEMPPKKARKGQLTEGEKEVIRAWIKSGAPPEPSPSEDPGESAPTPSLLEESLSWIGRFHIMVIHFPIALLLAAALGELWCAWRRVQTPRPPVQFCVILGATGAVVAAPLGWLLAEFGGYGARYPDLLALHRWLGTSVGVLAVGLAALSGVEARRQRRSWLFRILLWISALLVGAAGHFGGLLVHGRNFLNW